MRAGRSYALAALFFSLCAGGCGKTADHSEGAYQGTIRRGLSAEPSTLDPAAAADNFSYQVLEDLYEGLTAESPTGEAVPGVADSWTVDESGTQYTFHLRAGARWSNGNPVRARDFVAGWQRVVDPKRGSPVADDLRLIAGAAAIIGGTAPPATLGVSAPSDGVLVVKLEEPAPYLPQLLTHPAAYPIFSDESAASHAPAGLVSNGPYVLSRWSPGTEVDLTKNPEYWDRANVHVAEVHYLVASDENSQYARYRAGQLDLTDSVPANAIPTLRAETPTELMIAPYLATAYYGLNLSRPPFAANPKLRQALTMAVDRRRLVASLAFGQTPAYGFVPPGTANYTPQSADWKDLPDAERLDVAKRLYAEAGFSPAKPLHLSLLFNANPVIKNTALIVASMWKDSLGIEVTLDEQEYRVFLQSRHDKSRWDVARLAWTADFNDASNFLDTFRSRSPNNDSGYSNSGYDESLDQAAHTADPGRRRAILESAEKRMIGEYPLIPLYYLVSKRLVKPYVKGFEPNPLNRIGSKSLSLLPH